MSYVWVRDGVEVQKRGNCMFWILGVAEATATAVGGSCVCLKGGVREVGG